MSKLYLDDTGLATLSAQIKSYVENNDTKVTNTLATTTRAYVTGTTSSTTNTGTQVFDTGVYLGTTAGNLVASTFTGSLSGNATTATTLATARTIQTNLASTTAASFNGSDNITPGVTGILPITNGGTGTSIGHLEIALTDDTTSTEAPALGSTITMVDDVIRDDFGHVTTLNTKTVTLPSTSKITLTNPTAETTYYGTFATGSGTTSLLCNNGFQYISLEGTASALGYGLLKLGNSTASGTAANKYGSVRMYGTSSYYWELSGNKTGTSNKIFYLPNATSGTSLVAVVNDTQIGSGVIPVYVSSTGEVTASSSTAGTSSRPVYLSGGTITACSSTIGSSTTPVYMSSGTITACESSLDVDITGNAATTDLATEVTVTTTNPDSGITYYPTWVTGAGSTGLNINDGFRYRTGEGTADTNGYSNLVLGNSTASGTATNKYGIIQIFGTGSYYWTITGGSSTTNSQNSSLYLPKITSTSGYIVATNGTSTSGVGSASQPVYIAYGGVATACSSTIGSSTTPVYMSSGTITACGSSLAVDITGTAAKATADASGNTITDTYALKSIYADTYMSLGRTSDTTVGTNSIAYGTECEASGEGSMAFGSYTTATGAYSHAEGYGAYGLFGVTLNQGNLLASGDGAHVEGYTTKTDGIIASGIGSHAEGYVVSTNNTTITASGYGSHAEGTGTTASGNFSHAEGVRTTASSEGAHAEGSYTTASGSNSHAEGYGTTATRLYSHAEGYNTTVNGLYSHAEGYYTTASGDYTHAEGYYATAASNYSKATGYYTETYTIGEFVTGQRNTVSTTAGSITTTTGNAFVIGNGTSSSKLSNAFRVTKAGAAYGLSSFNSSGADYAEFIKEWADGNEDNEDRIGYFVTVRDGLLYKANDGDYIAGITSGNPSVVGNGDENYYWRYERDEFNRFIMEDVEEEVEQYDEDGNLIVDEETGEPIMVKTGEIIENGAFKWNEDYDPTQTYIERKDRPEWDYVGMMGVIPVRDDGTCEAGSYCKCGEEGVATSADTWTMGTYYVVERISDNVISVIMK